jgi:hypothetical protein
MKVYLVIHTGSTDYEPEEMLVNAYVSKSDAVSKLRESFEEDFRSMNAYADVKKEVNHDSCDELIDYKLYRKNYFYKRNLCGTIKEIDL